MLTVIGTVPLVSMLRETCLPNFAVFYRDTAKIERKVSRMRLYVIREKNGLASNSRPCNNCIRMMRRFGIKKVYYSTMEGDIVKEKIAEMTMNHDSYGVRMLKDYLG